MATFDPEIDRSLSTVPEPLRGSAAHYLEALGPTLGTLSKPHELNWRAALPRVLATSDFVAQQFLREPTLLQELDSSSDLYRGLASEEVHRRVRSTVDVATDLAQLKRALRHARRRETVRLAFRSLAGWADVAELLTGMSALADACIEQALDRLFTWAVSKDKSEGADRSGERPPLVVLGLGKLGGEELNFSSDVDLMFAYADDADRTDGRVSNHEFYVRLGQSLINALSETTEDGFVFRVDMRLRPNGDSGPLALSFDAMEHYYQTHGREWERYALIKARVVAGDRHGGAELLARLRPFIYRKYLDYAVVEAIRTMKARIDQELRRKGVRDNIKLGPGGIREIEFIAQALQLIRGGRQPVLQARPAIEILARLGDTGDLPETAVRELTEAYRFLRDAENHLQMIADRQVHSLPTAEPERTRLAYAMGYGGWTEFATALDAHRRRVDTYFARAVAPARRDTPSRPEDQFANDWLAAPDGERQVGLLRGLGYPQAEDVLALLRGLRAGPHYQALSTEGRTRLDRLLPALIHAAAQERDPQTTFARLIELIEAIGRRSAYLVLLSENPTVLAHVVKLCAVSSWIAHWLSQHPILLDELLDPRNLYSPQTRPQLVDELQARLGHIPSDDFEMQLDVLREFRHAHVLRVAAADIAGGLVAEQVGTHLAEIAEIVLAQALKFAYLALSQRHGEPRCPNAPGRDTPGFAVIAYGKLGSVELGYASDLDMIFLYEECEELARTEGKKTATRAPTTGTTNGPRPVANELFFARLGQRLIHIITTRTAGGNLYEVDMRLRPSGNAGPLVTSLQAFRTYQIEQAWTWEHQALVRARAVAGDSDLCRAFEEVRRAILTRRRDAERLRRDVSDMRARMLENRSKSSDAADFDLKHDRGGIVDIEFMVQYWVLRWAADYPEVAQYTDNIHILESLAAAGRLEPARKRLLAEAYRRYLSAEHRLKLMERDAVIPRAELDGLPDEIAGIWRESLNEE